MLQDPKDGTRMSRTKLVAIAGGLASAIVAGASMFGFELPVDQEAIENGLMTILFMAAWLLRDSMR